MEFTEVMRQANRACLFYKRCDQCILWEDGRGCMMRITDKNKRDLARLETMEKLLIHWAKTHPEPVYPSWKDSWMSIFPDGETPCPAVSFGLKYKRENGCVIGGCKQCKERSIPAEIAEKLGIKPIEAKWEGVE